MKLGTAKIQLPNRATGGMWMVTWMNVGSFLRNEPRFFWSEGEAKTWCRERGLRVAAS
jgi:hypothetical protein